MKRSELKLLVKHNIPRKVVVMRATEGPRSTSRQAGWIIMVNEEPMSSARKSTQIFARIDSAQDYLENLGIFSFYVHAFYRIDAPKGD